MTTKTFYVTNKEMLTGLTPDKNNTFYMMLAETFFIYF